MPNLQNAKKALRQAAKRTQRNKIVKAELKSLRIGVRKALDAKKTDGLDALVKTLSKKLDKAAQKKVIKTNTSNRLKSRMMKKVNAIKKATA